MPVQEAKFRVSSKEFIEWIAYDQISPLGPERIEYMLGVVACTIANAQGRKNPLKVSDFVPKYEARERQTAESMFSRFLMAGKISGEISAKQDERRSRIKNKKG